MNLHQPLTVLPGVGERSAEKFGKLGIHCLEDLLFYYPFRFEDLQSKSVFDLVDGEKAVISGVVSTPASVSYYGSKRSRLRFSIKQGEAVILVHFFNQAYLEKSIHLGERVAIFGKWDKKKASLTGIKLVTHIKDDLQPIYHLAQGISQASLTKLIKTAFQEGLDHLVEENLPVVLLTRYRLLSRPQAVRAMHFPRDMDEYKQALRRVKFEELFYFQMQLHLLKEKREKAEDGLALHFSQEDLHQMIDSLPFALTASQHTVVEEILQDLAYEKSMNRLLQGDVGSGKTVVAGLAMYATVRAGFQVAMMVPTEILASQHYESLVRLFPTLSIALLTGKMKPADKKKIVKDIASGSVQLIVGTHALIQESVQFHLLGLVVTDEQHRFGVHQRQILREKGRTPNILMMTATPIPRTLAITAFGDMDISTITQLPEGRKPVITRWVKHEQFALVLDWLKEEIEKNKQVYVISPLIEESENLDLKNAITLEEELRAFFGSTTTISLLHGRMKTEEKESIMQDFKEQKIDVLVSTTVIEVGINVPNASIIIIMDADRFGLSQLHQLRGRVGRGHQQSYAILVSNPKTEAGKRRMKMMVEIRDGFRLAQEDLNMRGSGEIFGTRQSGLPAFQVAHLIEDYPILEEARKVAKEICKTPNWRLI